MKAKLLFVVIEATDSETVESMIDQLCRAACDIANSADDDNAHCIVEEHVYDLATQKDETK